MTFMNGVILSLFVVVLLALVKESSAINCFVCHSINGSHPHCENNLDTARSQRQCRTTIGSINRDTLMMAVACVTLVGEIKDKDTGKFLHTVSRKCTAATPPYSLGKNVHCGLYDSDGHIPGKEAYHINGCTEACFENDCNELPLAKLSERFGAKYREHYAEMQRNDPDNRLRFPSIFALEEKRLSQLQQSEHPFTTINKTPPPPPITTTSASTPFSAGLVIVICSLIFSL